MFDRWSPPAHTEHVYRQTPFHIHIYHFSVWMEKSKDIQYEERHFVYQAFARKLFA